MKFRIEVEVSDERIKDVLIGAFEGGSNYWYWITDQSHKGHPADVIMDHEDGWVKIKDDEEGCMGEFTLTKQALYDGLQKMANQYAFHFNDVMEENDDAVTADVLLQMALFGELVYG